METITKLTVLLICYLAATSLQAQTKAADREETKTVQLTVNEMSCQGCPYKIHTALSEKKGIINNRVNNPHNLVWVKYNPSKITVNGIIKTIKKAGFKAERRIEAVKSPCTADCSKPCCSNNVGGKCKCFERGKDCPISCCGAD